MNKKLFFILLFALVGCSSFHERQPQSELAPTPWYYENTFYQVNAPLIESVYLRTGYYLEAKNTNFKGCVLYLEGLGDSVANQAPLFQYLSANGYRVIFFDDMGQGGSQGSMNDSRIVDPLNPSLEISTQAKSVWEKYAHQKDEVYGRDCSQSKKMLIGWSTGGLAAYSLANDQWPDAVVLITPGIHTRKFLGEAATSPQKMLTGAQVITERTLTSNTYKNTFDPHIEPIKPISPYIIPMFAMNMTLSSELSQHWTISPKVKGLVFLSGPEDTYVDSAATRESLKIGAPHFAPVIYQNSLHEIQNEVPAIANDMHQRTVQFFDSLGGK